MRVLHLSLLGLCLVLFTSFATTDLALPGPQYDEASHAALTIDMLHPKNPFSPTYTLHLLGRPLPFGTDPHTGASKAYLFFPFFSLFGPSVEVQRGVTVAMGCTALLFCYFFMRRTVGIWPAFWTLLFLSLDSSFIFYSKLDAGPIVEKLMWMMLCLWSFAEWGKHRKFRYLIIGLLGAVAGMYSHIAFIWFILASLTSSFFLFRKEIHTFFGKREQFSVILAAGLIFILFLHWLIGARDLLDLPVLTLGGLLAILERLATQGGIIPDVLGPSFHEWIKTRPLTDIFFVVSIVFLMCYSRSRAVTFIFILMAALLFQMSLTPGAILPHRIMMLYIFFLVLAGVSVSKSFHFFLTRRKGMTFRRLFSGLVILLMALSLLGQFLLVKEVIQIVRTTGGVGPWSDEIYHLAQYLEETKWERVVCVDWGFRKNLFLLTKGEILLEELFWHWDDEQKMQEDLTQISHSSTKVLFLLHPTPYWVRGFPTVRRFERVIERAGAKVVLQKTFYERSGKPVYLVYTIESTK